MMYDEYSSAASPDCDGESDIDLSVYSLGSGLHLYFPFQESSDPEGVDKQVPDIQKEAAAQGPESLLVLSAKMIAIHFPFELVESGPVTVPEELQRLISFHSFPTDVEDIWLYSCLSSGGCSEFNRGEQLWADNAVRDCVQIGFHLSATVSNVYPFVSTASDQNGRVSTSSNADHLNVDSNQNDRNEQRMGADNQTDRFNSRRGVCFEHRVSLTFDRRRITSCSCTCTFEMKDRYTTYLQPRNSDLGHTSFPGFQSESYRYDLLAYDDSNNEVSHSLNQLGENYGFPANTSRLDNLIRDCGRPAKRPSPSNMTPNEGNGFNGIDQVFKPQTDFVSIAGHNTAGTWCSHVVATCLMRIRQPNKVLLRPPISESLSKLSKEDLQKFAQNLICHVGPKKILPAAQRILDQLLDSTDNPLKCSAGAPDPTAGGALGDPAVWCFDSAVLERKLRVTLRRFWTPRPFPSGISSLTTDIPTTLRSFVCVLNSLRSAEPIGLGELLCVISDMMRRQDNNGVLLLEIVTRCILDTKQFMSQWYTLQLNPCIAPGSDPTWQDRANYTSYWLCEEIVNLWRLACLNPEFRPQLTSVANRFPSGGSVTSTCSKNTFDSDVPPNECWLLHQIARRLRAFHIFALEKAGVQVAKELTLASFCTRDDESNTFGNIQSSSGKETNELSSGPNIHDFLGFKPALAACSLAWSADPPPTYGLSEVEFRKIMPTFVGARVTTDAENRPPVLQMFSKKMFGRTKSFHIQTNNSWETDPNCSGLFTDLPMPHDEFELAFAKFQALDAHGHYDQALHWARYLACCLLYSSQEFLSESERIAFEVVGQGTSGAFDTISPTKSSSSVPAEVSSNRPTSSGTNGQLNSRRSRKHGAAAKQSSFTANKPAASRSKKWNNANSSNGRGSMEKNTKCSKEDAVTKKMAIKWAEKVVCWLVRVRYLITCLIRTYRVNTSENSTSSLTHRITSNGQTLLTTQPQFPRPIFIFGDKKKDNSGSQKPNDSESASPDTWMCIDVELAFRLGFCALTLIRPPTPSPILEIRLYDLETDLLSHLCSLPLHLACPHVLLNIRTEAKRLSAGLSTGQRDIMVPFSLAVYLFHQLVGVLNGAKPRDVWFTMYSNVVEIHTENPETNRLDLVDGNPKEYPILSTGAILVGSGLPLVVSIHDRQSNCAHDNEGDGLVHTTNLEFARNADANLGFETILSVIGVKPRVQEQQYVHFIEAQRAQEDAIVEYLFRGYRNDVRKLDKILDRLFDRYYNPHFKCPPLWACLNLGPRDLMAYKIPKSNSCQERERSDNAPADCFNPAKVWEQTVTSIPPVSIPSETMCSLLTENSLAPEVVNLDSGQPIEDIETVYSMTANPESLGSATCASTEVSNMQSHVSGNYTPPCDQSNTAELSGKDSTEMIETQDLTAPCTSQTFSIRKQRSLSIVNDSFGLASTSEDTDTLSDSKIDALRCAALRDVRKRPQYSDKMAAVDTSAPETTSSDNSPAAIRRLLLFGKNRSAANLTESSDGGCAAIAERYYRLSHPSTSTNTELPNASATPTPNVTTHQNVTGRSSSDLPSTDHPIGSKPTRPRNLVATSFAHILASSSSFSSFSDDDDHIPNRPDITPDTVHNPDNDAVYESFSPVNSTIQATTSSSPNQVDPVHDNLFYGNAKTPEDNPEIIPTNKLEDENKTLPTSLNESDWSPHLQRPPPQSLTMSMAYHCFILAKSARELAGGQRRNDSFFVIEVHGDNTINRNLHLVAFQLGLYSLGLFNSLNPSWQSRTYSHYESWISRQVCEIGLPAACILFHSWRHHLTAVELLRIALQLSRENNRALVHIAAELCLASLSQCTTLKPLEIYQALEQCEKHSSVTFERALICVESNANKSPCGILPEIHFYLARGWFSIYQSAAKERDSISQTLHHHQQQQLQPPQTNLLESQSVPSSCITTGVLDTTASQTVASTNPFQLPHTTEYTNSMNNQSMFIRLPICHPSDRSRLPLVGTQDNNIPLQSNFTVQQWCNYNPNNPPPPNLIQRSTLFPMDQYRTHLMMYPAMVVNQNPTNHPIPTVMQLQHPGLIPNIPQTPLSQQIGPPQTNNRPTGPPLIPPNQYQLIPSTQFESNNYRYPFGIAPLLDRGVPRMLPIGVSHPPPNYPTPFFLYSASLWPPTIPVVQNVPFPIINQSSNPTTSVQQPPATPVSNFSSFNPVPHDFPTDHQTSCFNTTIAPNQSSQPSIQNAQPSVAEEVPVPSVTSGNSISRESPIVSLSHRLASMSTASSSVVVHPSMSDQASSVSETDSIRRTESLIDGSNDDGSGGALRVSTTDDRVPGVTQSCEPLDSTTTVSSNSKRLEFLNFKTTDSLWRSFSCAVCAIKKIFITQPGSNLPSNNITSGSVGTSNSTRPIRGKHNPQQNHRVGSFYPNLRNPNLYGDYTPRTNDANPVQYPNFPASTIRSTSSSSWTLDPCFSYDQTNIVSGTHVNSSPVAKTFDGQILWTFDVATRLGPWALRFYCKLVLQYVTCPFLMERVASTVINHFQKSDTLAPDNSMNSNSSYSDFNPPMNSHPSHNPIDPTFGSVRLGHPMNPYLCPPNHPPMSPYGSWTVHSMSPTDSNGSNPLSSYQPQFTNIGPGNAMRELRDIVYQSPQEPNKLNNPHIFSPSHFSTQQPFAQNSWPAYLNPGNVGNTHPYVLTVGSSNLSANVFDTDGRHLIECLINRTHTLFQKYIEQRLQYIGKSHTEWDELMDVILKAYNVHLKMPATDRNLSWENLLSRIQRHPKCGSKLWQRIITGIETADLQRST